MSFSKEIINYIIDFTYDVHIAICEWWKEQGFGIVTDDAFNFYGYKAKFYFGIPENKIKNTFLENFKREKIIKILRYENLGLNILLTIMMILLF